GRVRALQRSRPWLALAPNRRALRRHPGDVRCCRRSEALTGLACFNCGRPSSTPRANIGKERRVPRALLPPSTIAAPSNQGITEGETRNGIRRGCAPAGVWKL